MESDGHPRGSAEQRFEAVYRAHFNRVGAYLLTRADHDDAVEALSRTFEIAWRRFDDVPADPLPWLLGVARRVLSEHRRGRRRRGALAGRLASVTAASAPDHAELYPDREAFLAALADLSKDQREALLLLNWDGLTHRQTAAVLGCSRGALALKLHRARKKLHGRLGSTLADPPHSHSGTTGRPSVHPATKEVT
jgi:RNA polymerase sigma factor (sigma-70 family)